MIAARLGWQNSEQAFLMMQVLEHTLALTRCAFVWPGHLGIKYLRIMRLHELVAPGKKHAAVTIKAMYEELDIAATGEHR